MSKDKISSLALHYQVEQTTGCEIFRKLKFCRYGTLHVPDWRNSVWLAFNYFSVGDKASRKNATRSYGRWLVRSLFNWFSRPFPVRSALRPLSNRTRPAPVTRERFHMSRSQIGQQSLANPENVYLTHKAGSLKAKRNRKCFFLRSTQLMVKTSNKYQIDRNLFKSLVSLSAIAVCLVAIKKSRNQ